MRLILVFVLALAACGGGGENAACHTDTDCADGLRCALLESGDGAHREMCVNPNGAWDLTSAPKRSYVVPVAVGAGVLLVLLFALRASVRARAKRRAAAKS